MKLSAILEPLVDAGVDALTILKAVKAWEDQQSDALERRRANDRERQDRRRHVKSRDVTVTVSSHEGATRGLDNLKTKNQAGEKGKEEKSAPAALPSFPDFWSLYPNKVGKRDAETAFLKALKRADIETILAGLRLYAAKADDRPWCNPATWLNQDRWEDAPAVAPTRQANAPPGRRQNAVEALASLRSRERQNEPSGPIIDHGDAEFIRPVEPRLRGLLGDTGQALRWPERSGDH